MVWTKIREGQSSWRKLESGVWKENLVHCFKSDGKLLESF